MSDVFTRQPDFTPYTAVLPGNLCEAPVNRNLLGITDECTSGVRQKTVAVPSRRDAAWWAEATKEFDFEELDNVGDVEKFNRVLWQGVKGDDAPYPAHRSGADLRQNRAPLLSQWRHRTGQDKPEGGKN